MPQLSLAEENARQREQIAQLTATIEQLKRQLAWFQRQIFGEKSEKRQVLDLSVQPSLLEGLVSDAKPLDIPTQTIAAHVRKKKSRDGCVTGEGLRFDASVPVQDVEIVPPELQGEHADDYEIVRYETTHLLAQRPGSTVILRERRPVLKRKSDQRLLTTPAPARILDNCMVDVSFLAGLLIDKFLYHIPLYRQHQRLQMGGVQVARCALTRQSSRAMALLQPIAEAQFKHVLQSKVLALDETPIKAGLQGGGSGKMHQGYFWPLYGEDREVSFRYHESRAGKHLHKLLEGFNGTLLTDAYGAYHAYAANKPEITHANCWAHARRNFEHSLESEPSAAGEALRIIGELYRHEQTIRDKDLTGAAKQSHRTEHSAPVVKVFWAWCEQQCLRQDLTPQSPLAKALKYAMARQQELQVFLSDPEVAIDTNHLERALRVIPMGRRNWLFCMTEAGASDVATIQSLLVTCKLQGVNPYTYLVDVLQRVGQYPNSQILDLTPRCWKDKFADNPLRSAVDWQYSP